MKEPGDKHGVSLADRLAKVRASAHPEYCNRHELWAIEQELRKAPPSHARENVRPVPGCSYPDCSCAPHDRCVHVDAMLAARTPSNARENKVDEIVSALYKRFKEWSKRGFGPEDVTWCEVKADVLALLASAPSATLATPACHRISGCPDLDKCRAAGRCQNVLPSATPQNADTARLDFMERHLCRAGEVKNSAGQTVKLARVWSIMGELETLRETVDAMMSATDGTTKAP